MAKFSFEFKKMIVQEYLDGKGGVGYIAKRYNISHKSQIQRWINAYREFGDDGLLRSRQNNNYSFQFKLSVVELYLSSEISYQELALKNSKKCSKVCITLDDMIQRQCFSVQCYVYSATCWHRCRILQY